MVIEIFSFLFLFSHISGNSSFPTPLNPDEERQHLKEFANGSIEAKNILIERNLRLVAHIAKKYNIKDNEDLISVGTIGLIKAIVTFNADKGARLATYAARCIENATCFCVTRITPSRRFRKIYGYFASF